MLNETEIFRRVANHELTKEEAMELLRQLYSQQQAAAQPTPVAGEAVIRSIGEIVCRFLHLEEDELDLELSFKELGVDSITSVEIVRDVNKEFGLNLDAVVLYDYATIPSLAEHVSAQSARAGAPLRSPAPSIPAASAPIVAPSVVSAVGDEEVSRAIVDIVGRTLHLEEDEIDFELSFKELGVDSISSVEIVRDINKEFGLNLDAVVLYDYSTIPALTEHVLRECGRQGKAFETTAARAPQPQPKPQQLPPAQPQPAAVAGEADEFVQAKIIDVVGRTLHLEEDEIELELSFKELGVDSITSVEIVRDINKEFGLNLDAVVLYDYATIPSLTRYVQEQQARKSGSFPRLAAAMPAPAPFNPPDSRPAQSAKKITLSQKKNEVATPTPVAPAPAPQPLVAAKPTQRTEAPARPVPAAKAAARSTQGVAVIGMSGRFPGANNLREFWTNMRDGVDSVTEVPADRWNIDDFYDPNPFVLNKTNCRKGGYLEDAESFDPLFFNISPKEAEFMDPQQRVFLQEAWNALEDAGYSEQSLARSKCGVFVGGAHVDYGKKLAEVGLDNTGEAFTGLAASILAARISYFLNLTGPSIAIDTACSSSLVAIHLACQSILSGESDMALAGGIFLMFTPDLHIRTSMIEMISPSGQCRSFDDSADGAVFSEGVGVIVLKPLEKAIADRDHIYGVIRGSAINQDGKTNGITAPSALSQTRLELEVYERFGLNPVDVSYVEAHGTGTPLGDPIEIKALTESFSRYTQDKQFCAIGSVKSNIGHAVTASGVASVIKVLLSMKNKQIPASLHFNRENQHIQFADTPFYVNTKLSDWKTRGNTPRMAAVSSFGFSGTNCHLVIEEAPHLE